MKIYFNYRLYSSQKVRFKNDFQAAVNGLFWTLLIILSHLTIGLKVIQKIVNQSH